MKNKLTYLLAGSALAASYASAEIVLTEDLSAYGYIDASYSTENDASDVDGSVAEFELGFAFNPVESPWSAVAEISYQNGGAADSEAEFETVTITYQYSDELSFTVGNILTYVGFETYDATGLYQYSYYNGTFSDNYFAGYAFGASADYATDTYGLGIWLGEVGNEVVYELFGQYTGVEGLTLTAAYASDNAYDVLNLWGSYEIDAFTFALEFVDESESDYTAYMGLVYYSFGDAGLTLRYAQIDENGADTDVITISPSYAFSDNVFGLLEASFYDEDGGDDSTEFAAELIFSF